MVSKYKKVIYKEIIVRGCAYLVILESGAKFFIPKSIAATHKISRELIYPEWFHNKIKYVQG